jgi:parallel beta-helix repeat protein
MTIFPSSGESSTTIAGGTLSTDTTWTLAGSPYIINGNVTIQGTDGPDGITTLTIEPGAELRFGQGKILYIGGAAGNPGALSAIGDMNHPITFTSNQSATWGGVYFRNTADDGTCMMNFCIVEKAGSKDIWIELSNPVIRNSIVRSSGGYGIYIDRGAPELTGNTITGNGTYGVYCAATTALPVITSNTISSNGSYPMRVGANLRFSDNTFSGNGIQAIEIMGETISMDNTWKNIGCPYVITGSLTVQGTDGSDGVTTLSIEPGVELRFNPDKYIIVGAASGTPGAVSAVGNAEHPVTFTANQSGSWSGILVYNTADDTRTVFDHCIVEKATDSDFIIVAANPVIRNSVIRNSGNYGLKIQSCSPVITGNTISNNASYGVFCFGTSPRPSVTNNVFSTNGSYPMRIGANSLFTGNTYTGNAVQAVEILGETISYDKTWENEGCPYVITGGISVSGTDGPDGITTLTVKPGVEMRFNSGTNILIGYQTGGRGAISAIGDPLHPIRFTSNQDEGWGGIGIHDFADDATTVLDHCIVENAWKYNISIISASPVITSSIIRNSGIYGINVSGAGSNNTLIECCSITNNVYGIYTSAPNIGVRNNNIFLNSTWGIYNSSGYTMTASDNWWGTINGAGFQGSLINGKVVTTPFKLFENHCDDTILAPDTDHDGLSDVWEISHFGNLLQSGDGDYDNDGFSNWTEFMLGTDPDNVISIPANKTGFEYDNAGRINKIKWN